MQAQWMKCLLQYQANFQDQQVVDFGQSHFENQWALNDYIICDLSHFAMIRVSGQDAAKFLQGQLSCDVSLITEQKNSLGAFCNRQGRVRCILRCLTLGADHYLIIPETLLATTITQLEKYAKFSKVTVTACHDDWVHIGYSGPSSDRQLEEILQHPVPDAINTQVFVNELTIIRIAGNFPRFEIFGNITAMQKLWACLAVHAHPVGANAWALLDIHQGIAHITPQTQVTLTPHQLNLQLIDAISFTKGCYTGQEIIARTHYLGKLKQQLYHCASHADIPLQPGEKLYGKDHKTEIGSVVNSAIVEPGKIATLASLKKTAVAENQCYDAQQNSLQILTLPYELDPQ